MEESVHISVMAEEVIEYLRLAPGQTIVDGTLGGGGHTRLIAEQISPGGRVIACDRDLVAVERAVASLSNLPVTPVHANFCNLPEVLADLQIRIGGWNPARSGLVQ